MLKELSRILGVHAFPSQANYIMCRIDNNISSRDLATRLIKNYNILIKDLSEKTRFDRGNYIRIAVKSQEENDCLLVALRKELV